MQSDNAFDVYELLLVRSKFPNAQLVGPTEAYILLVIFNLIVVLKHWSTLIYSPGQ